MNRDELRQSIARGLGDMVAIGTATAGETTTITDTNNLIFADTDQLKGYEVYIYEGTNVGTARIITAFDATNHKITFPAMGSACTTTTKYEIHRKFRYADYERAINLALDVAQSAFGRDRLNYYVDKVDETLIINDLLMGAGQFERWASGASSAPDGFTVKSGSTIARESTYVDKGDYSAKLTNAGSADGYLQWAVSQYLKYAEKSFTVKGRYWASTASRVRARFTDGVTTTNSDYHSGGSGFENFEIEGFTLDASPTEMTLQLRIETGGAISAYFDNVRLLSGQSIYEYTLPVYPTSFATISEIWVESGTEGIYDYSLPLRLVKIIKTPTPKIMIDSRYISLTSDRRLRIIGQSKAQISREIKDEFVVAFSQWHLAMQSTGSEEMLTKADLWRDEKDILLDTMRYEKAELEENAAKQSRANPNSIVLESL